MTKAELVAAIAVRSGLKRDAARTALDAFLDCVTESLRDGSEVRIVGFGSFVPVERAEGMARNPKTGQSVHRAASKTVKFKVGEGLKGAMN